MHIQPKRSGEIYNAVQTAKVQCAQQQKVLSNSRVAPEVHQHVHPELGLSSFPWGNV